LIRSGGTVILIRGKHFGPVGAHLTATIGNQPCEETKWLSPEALHCLVPKGTGRKLPVRVVHCSCSADVAILKLRVAEANAASSASTSEVYFSYDEDALRGIFAKAPVLNVHLEGIPLQMHAGQLAGDYEIAYHSAFPSLEQKLYGVSMCF
jgi:hypothetical protein